jgi:hypothetical protein
VDRPYALPKGGISEEKERALLAKAGFEEMQRYGGDFDSFSVTFFRGDDGSFFAQCFFGDALEEVMLLDVPSLVQFVGWISPLLRFAQE